MEISIGCTGWSYDGWVGPFYPAGMVSSRFLEFYSRFFDITEVNSTFYRMPGTNDAKRWAAQTPAHFRFTAKLPQMITHEKRLKGALHDVENFLDALRPLDAKYLLSVIQLPPSLSFWEAREGLEEIFPMFARMVVEGRHRSWFSEDAVRYLTDRNICLVWNDVQNVQNTLPVTSDFLYLRIIGDRKIPQQSFGQLVRDRTEDLRKWAAKLEQQKDKVMFAAVLANNHYEGFAAATANKLRMLLGLDELVWKNQKKLDDF